MAGTLIVSDRKYHDTLRALFAAGQPVPAQLCAAAGEARRLLCGAAFELVVINAPLPDEFGRELALQALNGGADVALLCPAANADKLAAGLAKQGIFVLAKPLARPQVEFALRLIRTSHQRVAALQEQNRKLLKRLDDARLISQAKCALVGRWSMTEAEAHRTIEKRAMDARISSREAALNILKMLGPTTES